MTTTTNVKQTKLNIMTQSQYNSATKNATELYMVTDAQISYNDLTDKPTIPDTRNLANKDLSNLSSTGNAKFQEPLVSGTNIKTINNNSILGSGNLTLDGLPSQTGKAGKFLQTDGTDASWESAPFRNIGEIVTSVIPLSDAGLHLLDGSLINGSGIYSAFVDYIASIYDASANYFCTEADWQTAVTTYGVCGKFVYDSVNNTVRLPKVTGFIEGASGVANLGDLTEAGLPNITQSNLGLFTSSINDGFIKNTTKGTFPVAGGGGYSGNGVTTFTVDASRSNSIYGNSNTVQPQSVKILYYIVIATTTKTSIEVDIDEIATDLNGKADTDLSNVPASKGILTESYVNGTSWYRVYSDGWCEQGGYITSKGNNQTIYLLQAYKDTNYSVITSNVNSGAPSYTVAGIVASASTFLAGIPNEVSACCWYAFGYIR